MNSRMLLGAAAAVVVSGVGLIVVIVATGGPISAQTLLLLSVTVLTVLALLGLTAAWGFGLRRMANARATRLANLERRMAAVYERVMVDPAPNEELRRIREAVDELERTVVASSAASTEESSDVTASLAALGRSQGLALTEFLAPSQALGHMDAAVRTGRILDAIPYLDAFPEVLNDLDSTAARRLFNGLRRLGYLGRSVLVIEAIAERFGNAADAQAARVLRSELALYRGEIDLDVELPPLDAGQRGNVVLHVVGKALPETQSGYTLRTQYTVEAQRRAGIEPVVVSQAGAGDRAHEHTETYRHRGIRYYSLGGPQRGVALWDEWLRKSVFALADVVRHVRPSAIHTHSDFMNAMIALPVARAYGIPVVNETRGFWEESWLSRVATAEGWTDLDELAARHGLPDMYRLRVQREAQTRSESDAVVTLARVMRDHIQAVGMQLGMPAPPTSIAPNSVQAEEFPVSPPDEELREHLGLPADGFVVGYISSIVEYEGIDTLVRAMYELELALGAAIEIAAEETTAEASRPDIDAGLVSQVGGPGEDVVLEALQGERDLPRRPLHALRDSLQATGTEAPAAAPRADRMVTGERVDRAARREAIISQLLERMRLVRPGVADDDLRSDCEALIASVQPFIGTPVSLLVVGDGAELSALRALAQQLGLQRVLFAGRVPHERVLSFYGLIDLFVVPRKRAAVTELVTPLKPFEAMSTGRPCVFSDVTALAEIASDSGCVALFRADDHHDLALTLADLLGDPDRLARMSRDGAQWVRAQRSWDNNARAYLDVYRSLGLTLDAAS